MATFYQILEVSPTADETELKRAYRRRQRLTHPDVPGGDAEAFRRVQEAWETLGEPGRRAAYDESLRRPSSPPQAAPRAANQRAYDAAFQTFVADEYMQRMAEELRRIQEEELARRRRENEMVLHIDRLLQPSFPFYGRLFPQYYRWYVSAFTAGVDYDRVRWWKRLDSVFTVLGVLALGVIGWFALHDPSSSENVTAVANLIFIYAGCGITACFLFLMIWAYRWGRWVLGPHFRRLRAR